MTAASAATRIAPPSTSVSLFCPSPSRRYPPRPPPPRKARIGSVATTCTAATRTPVRITLDGQGQLHPDQHPAPLHAHPPGRVDHHRVDLGHGGERGEEDRRHRQQGEGDEDGPRLEPVAPAQGDGDEEAGQGEGGDGPADVDHPGGHQLAPADVGQEGAERAPRSGPTTATTAAHRRMVSPAAARMPLHAGPRVGVEEPLEQADVAADGLGRGEDGGHRAPARRRRVHGVRARPRPQSDRSSTRARMIDRDAPDGHRGPERAPQAVEDEPAQAALADDGGDRDQADGGDGGHPDAGDDVGHGQGQLDGEHPPGGQRPMPSAASRTDGGTDRNPVRMLVTSTRSV